MLIGVPKEIKTHEYRVGLVPASVRELVHHGHKVLVQTGAGAGIGFDDKAYTAAGAKIAASAEEVFAKAEMIVKVKEPQPKECKMLREGQMLFTYLHLAPDPEQTKALLKSGCTAIAYETVTSARGGLPLLAPMSEVAGRMSIQVGAHCLEKAPGGSGILLGGVPGVPPARSRRPRRRRLRHPCRAHGHGHGGQRHGHRQVARPAEAARRAIRREALHPIRHGRRDREQRHQAPTW